MARLPIRWIAARAHCQATEEEDRVVRALDTVVVGGTPGRQLVEGQFTNPIAILTRRLDTREDLEATWTRWRDAGLPDALSRDLAARVDEDAVLHLRVDKQEAYRGRLRLTRDSDAIDLQVKVEAYPSKPAAVLQAARALLRGAV